MKYTIRMLAPAILVAAAFASGAQAQTADKTPAKPQAQDHSGAMQRPSAETMQRLMDGRIAMAKTTLKLTDAQAKLWQPVEDMVRARQATRIKAMQERQAAGDQKGQHGTLAERLERNSARMAKRAEEGKAFAGVFRPFYESLSEEQKAVAGPLLAELNGGGQRMHGHRWAGRRGHGSTQQ